MAIYTISLQSHLFNWNTWQVVRHYWRHPFASPVSCARRPILWRCSILSVSRFAKNLSVQCTSRTSKVGLKLRRHFNLAWKYMLSHWKYFSWVCALNFSRFPFMRKSKSSGNLSWLLSILSLHPWHFVTFGASVHVRRVNGLGGPLPCDLRFCTGTLLPSMLSTATMFWWIHSDRRNWLSEKLFGAVHTLPHPQPLEAAAVGIPLVPGFPLPIVLLSFIFSGTGLSPWSSGILKRTSSSSQIVSSKTSCAWLLPCLCTLFSSLLTISRRDCRFFAVI